MPVNYSATAKKQLNVTSATDPVLLLMTLSHPDLITPVRITNNTEDVMSNGDLFIAMPFEITLPDDLSQGQPRADLSIDNVGRVLTQWLDDSAGGDGATVLLQQILFSAPDVIEWSATMDLFNVSMNSSRVTATLAFANFLDKPGVRVIYRPDTAPGLF